MRTSEWIQASFAAVLALAAWLYPLHPRRRAAITWLATFALGVIALGRLSVYILAPRQASIFRDWLPVPLTLIPYWQTGQFFTAPNQKIQTWLIASDRWFFQFFSRTGLTFTGFARLFMEWAYMLCYPMVPAGLAVLYAAGLRGYVNTFWFFALVPAYLCYVITPFFPALPPRDVGLERITSPAPESRVFQKSRVFNLWILKHGSIHAISFPSAHVAASLAVSLILLHYVPVAGLLFLMVTFWIAVAAVAGGHHYVLDVLLGALLTLIVYAVWRAHLIPSALFTAPAMALLAAP